MVRMARVVVPGVPHHVTQRGSRRQRTFFSDEDYQDYLALLREWAPRSDLRVWAHCLMPNHVHLIVVPGTSSALAACMSQVHRRHAVRINERNGWKGHLWQERFCSVPMDDRHTHVAARYVVMNPVRAGLVGAPEEWRYSSLLSHLGRAQDGLIANDAFDGLLIDWRALSSGDEDMEAVDLLRANTRTGRPVGDQSFISRMESVTGRSLSRPRLGRPRKE